MDESPSRYGAHDGCLLYTSGKEILADLDMKAGSYELQMKVKSNLDDLAQLPVTVYLDNIIKGTPVSYTHLQLKINSATWSPGGKFRVRI